jgi:phosphoglycerol transferase MdoB-like AlkP superfamily enzyme
LWAIVLLPFCFDSPFHATRLAASLRCDSRFWRQLRSFNPGLFFVYLSLLISLFLSNRSILRSCSCLSNYLARYAFLVNITVSSYPELYQYNLIDNDILALLYPNHGFNRGEYMLDMLVFLHYPVIISPRCHTESNKEQPIVHLTA